MDLQPNETCKCSDPGCPVIHPKKANGRTTRCAKPADYLVFRLDMRDETGTPMCDQCAADAMDSGLFDTRKADN